MVSKIAIIHTELLDSQDQNSLMKERSLRKIIQCLFLAFQGTYPEYAASEQPFFRDKERGWFWREEIIESPPSKPKKEAQTPPTSPQRIPEDPKPLSVAWLRKNLEVYRDQAIDAPTPENVAAYFYLQRVMMDKAHRFTDVAHEVVISDPRLDENVRRPISSFAVQAANREATKTSQDSLSLIAKSTGILFFFRSDCTYCHLQSPLLKVLEDRYGFKIYPVSLDGLPMPGGLYPDFHHDQGQAAQLGVQATPALFLLNPPGKILPLAQGVLSLDDLTNRILTVAHSEGLITDADYDTTRGQNTVPSLITSSFPSSEGFPSDPNALISHLQGASITGGQP
ncbi:MAG: conjugal transfer protein TraF [Gammaproteobacteria bacterium]|nr:conjugal transfer protein TraF [Gammaproteobacteria bacterium]NBT43345.1 conjugal transfer protein TraF [Gammaproteobacteria bacterium]NBY21786.1 conjugal transfer protein TraF [Gammaproteobacteria bacterium]